MARILIGNIRGPQGIQGPKGDKGDTGATGPAGPAGAVDNTTPIEFTEAAQRANLVSGDSISTLFSKQKKWNADMKGVAFSGIADYLAVHLILSNTNLNSVVESGFYMSNTNAITGTLVNCPTQNAFFMIVGRHSTNSTYQMIIEYLLENPKVYFRNRYLDNWGTWHREYTTVDKPTPADIGAASAGELTSCWSKWGDQMLAGAGWYRIASVRSYSPIGCTISLKRAYTNNTDESHECKFVSTHNSKYLFKSIYDSSGSHLIKKIRVVQKVVSGETFFCLDIYYDSSSENIFIAALTNIVCGDGTRRWQMTEQLQTVPETATGETVVATLEFEANSWLGGSL